MKSAAALLLFSVALFAVGAPPSWGEAPAVVAEPGILGMLLENKDGQVLVEKIYPATPASRQAVIQVGDRIVSVAQGNGEPVVVNGMDVESVCLLLKGSIGSKVRVSVASTERDEKQPREITLTRGPLPMSPFNPGDPAPAWRTGAWIKGEPVKAFQPGKVYLIECWATWCRPCIASIPRLNELHLKYHHRGLVVIGQNICQKDETVVRKYVDTMGDKMSYRVAMDEIPESAPDKFVAGVMENAWLQPGKALAHGVHTAFLVGKDGRIAWSGVPEKLEESMIEASLRQSPPTVR